MASSEKIWFCPDVFIDTSWVKFKHDTFFIVGATIIKSTSLLLHKLSELREEDECVSELHFTELNKGKAKMGIAFANEFWKCKEAYFRAIILKRDNEEFDKYSDKKQWRFLANSIHFLTTYKYLRANGNSVRIVLNRPRLFLDNLSEEFRHTHEFKMVLKESLKKQKSNMKT